MMTETSSGCSEEKKAERQAIAIWQSAVLRWRQGRIAGFRAAQRYYGFVAGALGPSRTGMGRDDWRICISCIKLLIVEPPQSARMTIRGGDIGDWTRVCDCRCSQVLNGLLQKIEISERHNLTRLATTRVAAIIDTLRKLLTAVRHICNFRDSGSSSRALFIDRLLGWAIEL